MFGVVGMSFASAALPIMAATAFEQALDVLRDLVVQITGKGGSDIVATDKITDKVESGDLPTFLAAMANVVGIPAKQLPDNLVTFGDAARFIAGRQRP